MKTTVTAVEPTPPAFTPFNLTLHIENAQQAAALRYAMQSELLGYIDYCGVLGDTGVTNDHFLEVSGAVRGAIPFCIYDIATRTA